MTDPIAAHLAAVRRDRYSDATPTARARPECLYARRPAKTVPAVRRMDDGAT